MIIEYVMVENGAEVTDYIVDVNCDVDCAENLLHGVDMLRDISMRLYDEGFNYDTADKYEREDWAWFFADHKPEWFDFSFEQFCGSSYDRYNDFEGIARAVFEHFDLKCEFFQNFAKVYRGSC